MGGNSVSCLHCMYGHLLHLCFVFDLFFNRSVSNHCSSNQSFFLFIKQTFHNNYEGCGIKFKTCVVFSCLFTDHSLHVRCSCSMYLPYVAIYCPQRCLIPPPQKKTLTFFSHTKNAAQTFHVYCQQVVNFSYLYCEWNGKQTLSEQFQNPIKKLLKQMPNWYPLTGVDPGGSTRHLPLKKEYDFLA